MQYIVYEEIGPRIREARKKRNLSQAALAERVGVGTTHISHIENCKGKPSFEVLINIMNELQLSPNRIFYGHVDIPGPVVDGEIAEVFSDCEPKEVKILLKLVKCLKSELREYNK